MELGAGTGFVGIACSILCAREIVITDLEYTMALMNENIALNTTNTNTNTNINAYSNTNRKSTKIIDLDDQNSNGDKDSNGNGDIDGDVDSPNRNHPNPKIKCQVCDWFNPPHISEYGFSSSSSMYPDLILVADCVWIEELVEPLMNTLKKYCKGNCPTTTTSSCGDSEEETSSEKESKTEKESESEAETLVIITYQQRGRGAHERFWKMIYEIFDSVVIVDTKEVCGLDKPDSFSLIECRMMSSRKK